MSEAKEETPPPRPGDLDALEFTRQGRVRWFHPAVLARAAQRVLVSSAFGDFLDKRELQDSSSDALLTHGADADELWIDFIADTGDGFDATYSVALLASEPELELAHDGVDHTLTRGTLLVLGGDEVYPSGSPAEYDDRFRLPFTAALPWVDEDEGRLDLVAIPGNHDWYDGLTNFMRVFCPRGEGWIGGRHTVQPRSYFAVRLAHDWWLWGIDIQFDAFIDDPQLRYFTAAAAEMGPDANLILCTAKPSWTDVAAEPDAFRNLAYLEDRIIRPAGIHLRLSLSGDAHHYARYLGVDGAQKITAGGGGAFLSGTHHLRKELDVPRDPKKRELVRHTLEATYPDRTRSRWMSAGALLLPWTNPQFMAVPAVMVLLLSWASQFGNRVLDRGDDLSFEQTLRGYGWTDHVLGLFRNPMAVIILALLLAVLIGFAKPLARWPRGWRSMTARVAFGALHLAGQIAAAAAVGCAAVYLASRIAGRGSDVVDAASFVEGWGFTAVLIVLTLLLGGVIGSVVMGAYLASTCVFGAHGNEAFSAVSYQGHKNFLRLHIGRDGNLTVYPIGLQKVSHDWHARPTDPGGAPWLASAELLSPHLIEKPIKIPAIHPSAAAR